MSRYPVEIGCGVKCSWHIWYGCTLQSNYIQTSQSFERSFWNLRNTLKHRRSRWDGSLSAGSSGSTLLATTGIMTTVKGLSTPMAAPTLTHKINRRSRWKKYSVLCYPLRHDDRVLPSLRSGPTINMQGHAADDAIGFIYVFMYMWYLLLLCKFPKVVLTPKCSFSTHVQSMRRG